MKLVNLINNIDFLW